jgi:hypothetical protein
MINPGTVRVTEDRNVCYLNKPEIIPVDTGAADFTAIERHITMEIEMTTDDTHRKTATIAGVLFIIATFASILSTLFLKSVNASDYLVAVSANQSQVTAGALLLFIAAITSAGIAISLYSLLKKYNKGLALGAVCFRLIEAAFYLVGVLGLLLLLTLSQEFVKAGTPDASSFQILGTVLLAGRNWAGFVLAPSVFGIGALMYYYIFYQSNLIPRWLSGWGLIGATLMIAASMLVMFNFIGLMSTIFIVLVIPIAIQEMVLAFWLIIKGFNQSAIAAVSARG